MHQIVEVKTLPGRRLWVRFEDGTRGEVDVSDLEGRGVFAVWGRHGVFDRVVIGSGGELVWGNEVDLCADAIYLRLTGKSPGDVFPKLRSADLRA